jgi:hypothetical protein
VSSASQPDKLVDAAIVAAAAAARAHQAAAAAERDRLDARDRAIVAAVRAGARLAEIAEAAALTRAGASFAARRRLPPRSGRGGPYTRRRGAAAALREVNACARLLSVARERTASTKDDRNAAIADAVGAGASTRALARALGMTSGAVSLILRARLSDASTNRAGGAVAS